MANPNPGPLSKWLFIITMVGAVAYIGAAFAWVILPEKESVVVKTGTQVEKKEQAKKPAQATEPEKAAQPKKPTEGGDPK